MQVLMTGDPISAQDAHRLGMVAVHPDRAEGIGAFNEDREPTFADPDH
jgi:hypothetical protein